MTRTQRLVLAIAVLASFVAFLDGSVINVALPAISRELGGGLTTQQWAVDGYLITLGSLILVAGSLSDLFGRILILRVGLVLFGVASVAIAASPSPGLLITARIVQGIAGALLVPSSLALIMSHFRGDQEGKAIGTWTGLTTVAFIAGPVLGGLSVDLVSWRFAFLINVVPIVATLWLLVVLKQKDTRRPGIKIDLAGTLLGVFGLGGTVWAFIEQPRLGWGSPAVYAPLVGGVVALAGFVVREATAKHPMMPLTLFRSRNFSFGNGSTFLVYAALSLNGFLVSVYLQQGAHLPATLAGIASLPSTLIMTFLSSKVGVWSTKYGPRLFMTVGPIISGLGALALLAVAPAFNYWWQVLPSVLLFGLGLTITVSPLTSAILGAVDEGRSGIASAINNAVARIAGLIAIALLPAILGGTLDLAGLHRGAVACAVLLIGGGVVAFIGIRNIRHEPTAQPHETLAPPTSHPPVTPGRRAH